MLLITLFDRLTTPDPVPDTQRFSAIPISGYQSLRLGRDTMGCPALLISTTRYDGEARPTRFALEHLVVDHDVECTLSQPDGSREQAQFTIVKCVAADSSVRAYFLQVVSSILGLLGGSPSGSSISHAIDTLVELFRLMAEPPRESVQGLWAELLVLSEASDPETLLRSWHVNPTDVYDFNGGLQRIEVKSVAGRRRQHHFSLTQLRPPEGTRVLVASVLVEPAAAGTSLADLLGEVRARLPGAPELASRLYETVAVGIGSAWRQTFDMRYDRQFAAESLALFDGSIIPTVSPDLPMRVSDVQFRVDLDGLQEVSIGDMRRAHGIFEAALPSAAVNR